MPKTTELPLANSVSGGEQAVIIQAGKVVRGPVAAPAMREAAFGRGASVLSDGAGRIALAMAGSPTWGDAGTGDDADDGAGPETAKQSFEAILAAAVAAGGAIVLTGQTPFLIGSSKFTDANDVVGIDGRAVLDSRQEISGSAWVAEPEADLFSLTVTLGEESEPAGTAADSFHPAIWVNDNLVDWVFEGADIAANRAAVSGADNTAFTIHKNGSTVPDPRNDSAGTQFDILLKLDAGMTPADYASIKITSQKTKPNIVGGSASNLTVIGQHGKDGFGAVDDAGGSHPHFHNIECVDTPGHGAVGLFNSTGRYGARGRGIEGSFGPQNSYNDNQILYWSHEHDGETIHRRLSNSGGLVHFTSAFAASLDIRHEFIDVENFRKAIFGHRGGSAQQIARSFAARVLRAHNCSEILQFGGSNGKRAFEKFARIDHLIATEVDNGFDPGGDLFIGAGRIEFCSERTALRSINKPAQSASFDAFREAEERGQIHEFRNLTWSQPRPIDNLNAHNFWLANKDPVTPADGSLHLMRFIDCADQSAPDRAFHLERTNTVRPIHLQLIGSKLGPLHPANDAAKAGVAKITAKRGSVLGWKDMSAADAKANMDSLGIAHDIDADTVFIDRAGIPVL